MVGNIITGEDGIPLDNANNSLSVSAYNPSDKVKDLFKRVQETYQTAWSLQHRPMEEFDGVSLLQRARLDQQTFAAYVGAEYVPAHKRWKWKGRKNTARNKIIGILAHMLASMLFPYVYAYNDEDEEDKMTAKVMKILVEDHLKRAGYETKFLFIITSALVNPAVICEVEYVTAIQKVKQKLKDGSVKIIEAIDELLTGIGLNLVPIDQLLITDHYVNDIQRQPSVIKLRRISWDEARSIYAGKYIVDGKDQFDFVEKGKTRLMGGEDGNTLFDVDYTEADGLFVQEITAYYKSEDLEVTFVGGVFMGEEKDIYNNNPFKHRRMTLIDDEWISIPVYPFAKSGFEPIDPNGRFFYYKSAAFKEFWDDAALNKMQQLVFDGTYLDVIKPMFISGVSKMDSTVIIPGATVTMPQGATVTPYQVSPNLNAAYNNIMQQEKDLSESTQDKIMSGNLEKGVTAYATAKAEQNARVFLGVFGILIADLVKQIGELTMDCIIQHTTVGELDSSIPESLKMKYKKFISKGKESGKTVTNKIIYTDRGLGRDMSKEDVKKREWELFNQAGGKESDQRIYEVNPYKLARHKFSMYVDADQIISKSMGTDTQRKALAFQMMSDPRVAPFVDMKTVVDKLVIEEFSDGDPEQFKAKQVPEQGDYLNMIMGNNAGGVVPALQGNNLQI